ncbi:MAG: DUF2177 family protein [Gammaproteobacteria bacterium]|nr:DUF2177 family protein [Gammaproteobacteria bacterium]
MLTVKVFFIALVVFLVTDMIWLGFIAKELYFGHYSPWLRLVQNELQPIWWSAIAVYILFALSLIIFIFPLAHSSILCVIGYGALFGLIVYGVYDFTCLAIFKDWPVKMAFIDIAWGTFLYGWSSMLTFFIVHRILL